MAAFRMRCWYEMGDISDRHYVQDYWQLVDDAQRMRTQIIGTLHKEFPLDKRLTDEHADALAELLVTALLSEQYCVGAASTVYELLEQAYRLVPQLTNKQLLCYILVLILFYDKHPAKGMRRQLDGMLSSWQTDALSPEDRYVLELYRATTGF